jgi:hypothetical protein
VGREGKGSIQLGYSRDRVRGKEQLEGEEGRATRLKEERNGRKEESIERGKKRGRRKNRKTMRAKMREEERGEMNGSMDR